MICPNCNNQIQDNYNLCPYCGVSFIQPQPQIQYQQPQMNIQQQAAKNELNKMKKNGSSSNGLLLGFAAIIIAVICLVFGIFLGFIFFTIAAILMFIQNANTKKRMKDLDNISQGKTQYRLCPRCKSPNIQMNMVETGSTVQQGTTRISENINPLQPFTHVNVKTGPTISNTTYGNKCHCLACGHVFDKPEIIYQ